MKYYSEVTEKIYNTIEELKAAEADVAAKEAAKKALVEKKKERAEEVNKALENFLKAADKTYDLIKSFEKDYGHYGGIDIDKLRAFFMHFWSI